MVGSLVLFVLLIIFYILIVDIITIFFRLTGMTKEKARFQVISLLTNSGFTTKESETVVNTATRRKLATATMLFGYTFTVTILSATVNMFISMNHSQLVSLLVAFPTLILVLAGFFLLRRWGKLRDRFDRWIETIGRRLMFGRGGNQVLLVEEYGSMVVAHVYLHELPEVLCGVTLAEADLMNRYKIMVLLVKPPEGDARQADAGTVLAPGDTVMVLGRQKTIRSIFECASLSH